MKKNKTEIAKQSFVTPQILEEKFSYANGKLPVLDKTSLELKVESDEQLVIAQNNLLETTSLIKEVENIRKILGDPHLSTVKMINSYCKTITDNLERIKVRYVSQITDFKVMKEAQAKIEREKKLKELEILEAEKREESAKILRIESKLIAEIYGGSYMTKSMETKTVAGCIKESDCDDLLTFINKNAPDPRTFKYFQGTYEDMIISVKKKLAAHKLNIMTIQQEDTPIAREGAMKRINESRMEAIKDIANTATITEKVITKEIRSEVKSIDREVSEAGKGVRETLTYNITDETLVPRDMLSVDEKKVNAYMNDNKESIKEKLKNNEEVIPGIRFFIDNNFIAR